MRIYVLIPVYKRPKVFEKCLKSMNRIREKSEHEIIIYCAGNFADESHQVFVDYQKKWDKFLPYNNNPVSNKFNHLFNQIKNLEFDYATIIGSDNIISDKGWATIMNELEKYKYHYIALEDINFVDDKLTKAGYYKTPKTALNTSVGCFRFLHYNLLNTLCFSPFSDNRDTGIDYTLELAMSGIKGIEKKHLILGNKGYLIDIKSDTNINSFQRLSKIMSGSDYTKYPKEILDLWQQQ